MFPLRVERRIGTRAVPPVPGRARVAPTETRPSPGFDGRCTTAPGGGRGGRAGRAARGGAGGGSAGRRGGGGGGGGAGCWGVFTPRGGVFTPGPPSGRPRGRSV